MHIVSILQQGVQLAVQALYDFSMEAEKIPVSVTRKEFEGDYTVVVFPFTKAARKKPEEIGAELGAYLQEHVSEVSGFNVIKGFLNLTVSNAFWQQFLAQTLAQEAVGVLPPKGEKVMVEFSSPNTNKPLHLGHIRNILLGWSCAKILAAAGYEVIKVQVVNDRGIAICKSMLAWQKYGKGETPASTGMKGDHFVGQFYVAFEQHFKKEYEAWQETTEGKTTFEAKSKDGQSEADFFKAFKNTYFNEHSALGKAAKDMLLQWEAGDPETVALWKKMNGWVYEGFDKTYEKLGVTFDKLYYESDTYILGKDLVQQGLQDEVFYQKPDGSVWIDLEAAKLDHKLVLRSDGTSVYMTQDIGTAMKRYEEYGVDKMVYVVADEQNYHFQVLFEIMKRLNAPFAEGMYHLSYGMVELPTGKMKSREGTVVDADDLIAEVIKEAWAAAEERGEILSLPKEAQEDIVRKVALAALKYFIIKVQPKKWMTFDPKESLDMQGQTGPYIQYMYVRINGITQRAEREQVDLSLFTQYDELDPLERTLIQQIYQFTDVIQEAAAAYDPSAIAQYSYHLAKTYSKFWHDLPFFDAKTEAAKAFRLQLSKVVGAVLKKSLDLLGIEVPAKM